MNIMNPANGAVITSVIADDAAAVRKKYAMARTGQPEGAKLPISKRLKAIERFRERIVAMHEKLAETWTSKVAKPIRQSRNELNGLLTRIDFFLSASAKA